MLQWPGSVGLRLEVELLGLDLSFLEKSGNQCCFSEDGDGCVWDLCWKVPGFLELDEVFSQGTLPGLDKNVVPLKQLIK